MSQEETAGKPRFREYGGGEERLAALLGASNKLAELVVFTGQGQISRGNLRVKRGKKRPETVQ